MGVEPPQFKQTQIVINKFGTEYALIDQIAEKAMRWKVSKDQDWTKGEWDLWWNDLGIELVFSLNAKFSKKLITSLLCIKLPEKHTCVKT